MYAFQARNCWVDVNPDRTISSFFLESWMLLTQNIYDVWNLFPFCGTSLNFDETRQIKDINNKITFACMIQNHIIVDHIYNEVWEELHHKGYDVNFTDDFKAYIISWK